MSRRDSPSLKVRGVPIEVLDRLDTAARARGRSRNTELLARVSDYSAGLLAPDRAPAPFDPQRAGAAPYADDTAAMAISGIPPDVWAAFMARARADGWFSKNDLIVELLRK